MARQPQVTRTIKTTEAKVLCVNVESQATEEVTFVLPRTYSDDEKMLKQVIKRNKNEALKPVHIVSSTVIEELYGMPEEEFIECAEKIVK